MDARLFYLMGPSGSGKDSLLRLCRQRLSDSLVVVAHRYITRPPESGGENHVALTASECLKRKSLGLFAMTWQANGHHYGVGVEIDRWLDLGCSVLVNGSRANFDAARDRYGDRIVPVLITVNPVELRRRLVERRRECSEAIEWRLNRSADLAGLMPEDTKTVDNNGELETAFGHLKTVLTACNAGTEKAEANGF
jgi:ribose 1,5-bisphosphokinase